MNIRDVARLAEVSVATVSKVINKKDASVSAATREKILRIVKEYNYTPYANVRTPVKGTTLVIGVLVQGAHTQSAKLMGILSESHHWGYGALVYGCCNTEEEEKNIHVLSSYNVDGIVWERAAPPKPRTLELNQSLDIPFVSIGEDSAGEDMFGFHYRQLGMLCASHITGAYHTKICCIVPDESARSREFGQGVCQQLRLVGIAHTEQVCQVLTPQTDLKMLLCNCTAVICMNSCIAEKVAEQADNLGLHIPRDLSMICMNCDCAQSVRSRRISTVQLPFEEMGRFAVASLLARIESKEVPEESFALEPELDHRLSIEPPKPVRDKKIIVVGAINMDVLIGLDEVLQSGEFATATSCIKVPGGKGLNQAIGAAKLGADAYLIGRVGKDYEGSVIYDFLKNNKVNMDGVIIDEHANTGTAYIHVLRDGEASIVGYYGASDLLCAKDIEQKAYLFDNASYCLVQFVAIPDPQLVVRTVETARKKGVKVLLKPCKVSSIDEEILRKVDILVPNRKEAQRLVPDANSWEERAQYFLDRGVKHVIITLGHRGCYFRDAQHSLYFPAAKVTPVDTTGAGDAFAATLVSYLSDGRELTEAIRYATVAAGLSTARQGVPNSLVDQESIELYLSKEKIEPRDAATSCQISQRD